MRAAMRSRVLPRAVCGAGSAHAGRYRVVFGERTLSYAALDAHANRLAHHLQSLGVGPETMVGCAWSARRRWWSGCSASSRPAARTCRSIRTIPRERLAFMLADAGAPVLVTQQALLDAAAG